MSNFSTIYNFCKSKIIWGSNNNEKYLNVFRFKIVSFLIYINKVFIKKTVIPQELH